MPKLIKVYLFVAFLGLIDAAYLTYNRMLNIPPPCGIGFLSGCAIVDRSPYSVLLGVPLSVYGMVFYTLGIIAALSYFYINFKYKKHILLLVSLAGAISSVYFIYLQAFVINAFCIYCLFSALCTFLLLAICHPIIKRNTK